MDKILNYIQLQNILPNQSRDFEMYYQFEDVEYCNISLVDSIEENVTQSQFISDQMSYLLILTTLVYTCIF